MPVFFFFKSTYCLFLALLGLHCFSRTFSSCGIGVDLPFVVVPRLLTVVASLEAEHRLQARASGVAARRLRCSVACEIFPDQGLNSCSLHWQADSYPLHHCHQGSPTPVFLPQKFHGRMSLVGYSPWGRKESGTTQLLNIEQQHIGQEKSKTNTFSLYGIGVGTGHTTQEDSEILRYQMAGRARGVWWLLFPNSKILLAHLVLLSSGTTHLISVCLTLGETTKLFSRLTVPFYILTCQQCMRFPVIF